MSKRRVSVSHCVQFHQISVSKCHTTKKKFAHTVVRQILLYYSWHFLTIKVGRYVYFPNFPQVPGAEMQPADSYDSPHTDDTVQSKAVIEVSQKEGGALFWSGLMKTKVFH